MADERRSVSNRGTRSLDQMIEAKDALAERIEKKIAELWPVGATVHWKARSQFAQTGTVLRHGYDQSVFARNHRTGKEVRVRYSRYGGLYS